MNKFMRQFSYVLGPDQCAIFAEFEIGASGAVVSGSVAGQGLEGVVKESTAGQYTLTLSDKWQKLLAISACAVLDSATGVAAIDLLMDPADLEDAVQDTQELVIQLRDYAGAAVNAASGSVIKLHIILQNSVTQY